jgi:hypothetical protein
MLALPNQPGSRVGDLLAGKVWHDRAVTYTG